MKARLLQSSLVALLLCATWSHANAQGAQATMCMVGTATPYGYNFIKGLPMLPDSEDPDNIFRFDAWLEQGFIKFIREGNNEFPSWNRVDGTADQLMVRNTAEDPDVQFEITTAGNYSIVINLITMTCNITPIPTSQCPVPIQLNTVFAFGGGTPAGWNDFSQAIPLKRNPNNLYELIYEGQLISGGNGYTFLFVENRVYGWGDTGGAGIRWITRKSDTEFTITSETTVPQWTPEKTGNYRMVLNQRTMTYTLNEIPETSTDHVAVDAQDVLVSTVADNRLELKNLSNAPYAVYNFAGQSLMKGTTNGNSINIDHLAPGMYILNVDNTSAKFIKK